MMRRNRPCDKPQAELYPRPIPVDRDRQTQFRNNVRASIAHSAARLIAEGQTDYLVAKQKAARQHGVTDHHALPDNDQIELALREYYALFSPDAQRQILSAIRAAALRLMLQLEQFSPWLVGAVLNGTANEFSAIELELVGIEPKDFEIYLLNTGIEFELCEAHPAKRALPGQKSRSMKYRMEFNGVPVSIELHEHQAARQSANTGNGIKHDRAKRVDAENRFLQENAKPQDQRVVQDKSVWKGP